MRKGKNAPKKKKKIARSSPKAKITNRSGSKAEGIVVNPTKLAKDAHLSTLDFLEKVWPDEPSAEVKNAFQLLKKSLSSEPREEKKETDKAVLLPPPGSAKLDILDLVRRILMTQDMLFLSRQITYHISASSEIPKVWADEDRLVYSLAHLVEHIVKRSNRDTEISIAISEFKLRNGPGVRISFEGSDHEMGDAHNKALIDKFLDQNVDPKSGVSLFDCRQAITHQHGQMWIELPKPYRPAYNIILPASESTASAPPPDQQTFKYDISIINYANVRKRFGIRKSASLVAQIEHYVRSLVRYPIDMVMSVSEKGIISTIYETQKGAANSVASRISQRLGREEFRIGRRTVELMFKYRLSELSSVQSLAGDSSAGGKH